MPHQCNVVQLHEFSAPIYSIGLAGVPYRLIRWP